MIQELDELPDPPPIGHQTCSQCGCRYPIYHKRQRKNQVCSRQCRILHMNRARLRRLEQSRPEAPAFKTCLCGAEFSRKPTQSVRKYLLQAYCSVSCSNRWARQQPKSPGQAIPCAICFQWIPPEVEPVVECRIHGDDETRPGRKTRYRMHPECSRELRRLQLSSTVPYDPEGRRRLDLGIDPKGDEL